MSVSHIILDPAMVNVCPPQDLTVTIVVCLPICRGRVCAHTKKVIIATIVVDCSVRVRFFAKR